MSLSKESRTSSMGPRAQVKFPFELSPPIQKLTFGHQYAVQSVPLQQTITFINKTDELYRMTIVVSTSPKYTMEVDEEKIKIKRQSTKSVTITICFNTVITVGLTGSVTFEVKKKAFIGNEASSLTLRFQMLGVIPKVSSKQVILELEPFDNLIHPQQTELVNQDMRSKPQIKNKLIQHEDSKIIIKRETNTINEKDFITILEHSKNKEDIIKIGTVTGKKALYNKEPTFIFNFNDVQEDFNALTSIYMDIHHFSIVQLIGLNFHSNFMLLEADTQYNIEQFLDCELSIPFLTRCCINLVTALQYLSSQNILHRNIKPSKLRLVKRASPTMGLPLIKLHDFSCGIVLENGKRTNECVGTIEYMAPEVIEEQEYDAKVDVYSLGMTMYHIFNKKKPYGEMSLQEIKEFVLSGHRLSPTDKIPIAIIGIITKCWNQHPELRPNYKWILNALNDFSRNYTA
ncbi:hypothetical protein ENUP19_0265G0048 [Entamoeba nuttalli]|uniref:Protein kinase, putative n=2 Tax=Entamoeba nuttalli TaxID=412467 RepID=K2H5G6_ENTNP|nr:protein kinase, putative [Entamoeba nuttalli P19]EKE37689.1 protein kinase, putative [Entamoeba nuttalli P19]|eukprot:XP_008859976.1 protein kinase, putative [Entamoeba nuttalli P19]